jgi:hypothetical protein
MSIKFRPTDSVKLTVIYHNQSDISNNLVITDISFEIGPIINRPKYGWSTYNLILSPDISLDQKKSLIDERLFNNMIDILVIRYELFKKHFIRFQAIEIQDKFTPLSEEDLLNDVDFMRDEVAKIQIQMNVMKQKGEIERYQFYNDLISINMYKMFQFPNKNEFEEYIDKIRLITERDSKDMYNQRVNEIKEIEKLVWT